MAKGGYSFANSNDTWENRERERNRRERELERQMPVPLYLREPAPEKKGPDIYRRSFRG